MATVILKATEKCNSNCAYCDVVQRRAPVSMPLEVLETVFRRTDELLKENRDESVEILWHGGEPLLQGTDFFRAAISFQEKHCAETTSRISHSIQTNLTCMTEEFIEVFRRLGIGAIGTSYDPEPHVRGPGAEVDTDAYNRAFMKALRMVERNGIGWGMIYVVTRRSLADPLGVFFHLTNLLLSGGVNFNPVLIYDEDRRDLAVSPAEYVDFLGAIFPVWWKHRGRYPSVGPFKSLVECIIDGATSLSCCDSGACSHHHINVAPDGETSQCGRSSDWGLLPYGNIADRSFGQILGDAQRDTLRERVDLIQGTDCAGCRFWQICHGGCPLDSWSRHKDFLHKSEWCEARRGFIEKYFEPVTEARFEPRKS